MTYMESETPDWQVVPYDVETYLKLGPNNILSLPSAPLGGVCVEVLVYREILWGGSWVPASYHTDECKIMPVMIDYKSSDQSHVIVERRDPIVSRLLRFDGFPEEPSLILWNIASHPVSGHSYRIRLLAKHKFIDASLDSEDGPTPPTDARFKVKLRGLTQL